MRPAAVLVLLAGLPALAAPVRKTPPPPYFPTAVGAKWVYATAAGREEVIEVSGVEERGPDWVVSRSGTGGRYEDVLVSADGLRQRWTGPGEDVGRVWLVKARFRPGESWEAGGTTWTAHGPEEVEVPAGKCTAVRVVSERGGGRRTSWFARGVGEVKRVERGADGAEVVSRSLKSFKAR